MAESMTIRWDPSWQEHLARDVEGTLDEIASRVVDNAKRIVPVESGELRDSIHAEPATSDGVTIRADAPYAQFVEMGTSRMAAQPFLRPAMSTVAGSMR